MLFHVKEIAHFENYSASLELSISKCDCSSGINWIKTCSLMKGGRKKAVKWKRGRNKGNEKGEAAGTEGEGGELGRDRRLI